jgi:hypothetical protein
MKSKNAGGQSDAFAKERDAISKYGEVMYFWPDEVKVEVYGLPYAIPDQEEYAVALEDAKRFIAEEYGASALEKLGDATPFAYRAHTCPVGHLELFVLANRVGRRIIKTLTMQGFPI